MRGYFYFYRYMHEYFSFLYVYQSSDVTMEEITVQVTNEERMDDSPGAVFDVMVQTEKEKNSSGDA